VRVHPRRHRTERAEAREQVMPLRVGHLAREPVEQHDVALAHPGHGDLRDTGAGRARHRRRRLDRAVLAQGVDPPQLGLDLGRRVVAGAMDAQREAPAVRRVYAVCPVLGDVDQVDLRRRVEPIRRKRRTRHLVDVRLISAHGPPRGVTS
jgi:hypothetical protein